MKARYRTMWLEAAVFLSTLIVIANSQYYECPLPWMPFDNSCYKFQVIAKVLGEAEQECAQDSASLLSIYDPAEHEFVISWLSVNDASFRDWYTSGRRMPDTTDNTFFWEGTGDEIAGFQHWFSNDARLKNDDHIVYHTDGNKWGWTLSDANTELPFICEIDRADVFKILTHERTHDYGILETDPSKLQIGPRFIKQPTDFIYDTASVDKHTVMECVAEAIPQAEYQWAITKEQRKRIIDPLAETRYTIINGKLIIHDPSDTSDNGEYQCTASNKFGAILSTPVTLGFGYLLDFPKSRRDPVVVDSYEGVGIECNPPKHYPAVLFSWYKDHIMNFVRPELKPYIFISNVGKLYFSHTTKDDQGDYYCLVSSPRKGVTVSKGKVSMPIQLRVNEAIASIREPQIASGFPAVFPSSPRKGDNVRIECFAWGTTDQGDLIYDWARVGRPMPATAYMADHNRVLNIPNIEVIHAGEYRCTVTRINGQSSSATVQLPVEAVPFFTIPLRNAHQDIGTDLTWRCISSGIPPPAYRWYRNATLLVPETLPSEDRDRIIAIRNRLTIKNIKEKDAGMYQCSAENRLGIRFSSAQLRVLHFAPTFAKFPLMKNVYGTTSGNVTIICSPEAAPKAVIVWKKNGRDLSTGMDAFSRVRQMPNGNLFISGLGAADGGNYTCVASNDLGEASSSAILTILKSTAIISFPRNTVVEVNRTAFLPCEASYNALLDVTYVWYHNTYQIEFTRVKTIGLEIYILKDKHYKRGEGHNRGGLYIMNAQFEHAGEYTCIAESSSDRKSRIATLQVVGPPGEPAGVMSEFPATSRSIVLQWQRGQENGRPILSYLVEGYSRHENFWRELKKNIRTTGTEQEKMSVNVTGLSPASEYLFRVRAENELGMGQPSKPSESYTTAPAKPEVKVQNPGGGGGKVGDLTMTWDPLPPADHNGPGIGYLVQWKKRQFVDEEWSEAILLGGSRNKHVALVGSKNFYAPYHMRVRAFNDLGNGPWSDQDDGPTTIMSAEDIPIGVATNVRARPFNSTALMVTWNPVKDTTENIKGVLLGYRINYWKQDGEDETMAIYNIIKRQTDRGLVYGLEAKTYYWVNVQVYNSAGIGPKSQDFLEETLRLAPQNQPTEVYVNVVSDHSIRVRFRGVSTDQREEPLQGYMIRYWRQGETIYEAQNADCEKKTNVILEGLDVDQMYNLRVLGYSRGGDGLMSSPTIQFILGKNCRVMELSPRKRFVYECSGCMFHVSYSLLLLIALFHIIRNYT